MPDEVGDIFVAEGLRLVDLTKLENVEWMIVAFVDDCRIGVIC